MDRVVHQKCTAAEFGAFQPPIDLDFASRFLFDVSGHKLTARVRPIPLAPPVTTTTLS
jgi:hypothetical protein